MANGVDEDFALLVQLASGRAVIGQAQFLPGYSLLLSDAPGASRLTDIPRPDRIAFLADMESVGEAVERVCRRRDPEFRRINIEIQGKLTPTSGRDTTGNQTVTRSTKWATARQNSGTIRLLC